MRIESMKSKSRELKWNENREELERESEKENAIGHDKISHII